MIEDATSGLTVPLRKSPQRFLNRELSDLALIERVLEESANDAHPLLERLRFLSISADLLDQFFTVRVSSLKRDIDAGQSAKSPDGLTPMEQLRAVSRRADELTTSIQVSWERVDTLLCDQGIRLIPEDDLVADDLDWLTQHFTRHVLPALTPFTIDREHPFPFIPSGGICVVAELDQPAQTLIVPLPQVIPRFVRLPGPEVRFVTTEVMIALNWRTLFPHQALVSHALFQILRDNELALEERSDDLMLMVQSGLASRDTGDVIRLKFSSSSSAPARNFVARHLGVINDTTLAELGEAGADVTSLEIATVDTMLGISDAIQLMTGTLTAEFPHLTFPPYTARTPQRLIDFEYSCFDAIRDRDLLVHWPFETFDVVVNFLIQAAGDPDVLAIKQTLYRTSDDSPIVTALIKAAQAGKSVTAIVELEARDNEFANINLSKRMEAAGVQIVYGIVGLKVHCKSTYVVRREEEDTVLYAHLGTGNYHPANARIYTDLSFFTCDPDITHDVGMVFNYLTSNTLGPIRTLGVAPINLRQQLYALIDDEIAHAIAGRPATIWAKLNSLVDPSLIDKLYDASEAGVQIDLVIRRHCALKPGIPGLSSNIRVKSIIGRFLEHSRIYCFGNGGPLPGASARIYLASADWMHRNFDDRVELMVPMREALIRRQILEQIMVANLLDTRQSWHLESDGRYVRDGDREGFCAQSWFMKAPGLSGLGSLAADADFPRPSG